MNTTGRLAAAAAVLAVALAPAASGSTPTYLKDTLYGGGHMGVPGSTNALYGLHFVTVATDKSKPTVTFYGDWNARCPGWEGPVTANFVAENAPIKANGSFSATGRFDVKPTTTNAKYSFAGRFTSSTAASGTGRATFKWTDPDGKAHSCDTGPVTWEARASTKLAGTATVKKGASYYGNTEQSFPVIARVSADGIKVQVAMEYEWKCKSGLKFIPGGNISPVATIAGGRTFKSTETFPSTLVGPGRTGKSTVRTTGEGTFGETMLVGRWAFSAGMRLDSGKTDSCRSGWVPWSASL